jgi:hypothetical protein
VRYDVNIRVVRRASGEEALALSEKVAADLVAERSSVGARDRNLPVRPALPFVENGLRRARRPHAAGRKKDLDLTPKALRRGSQFDVAVLIDVPVAIEEPAQEHAPRLRRSAEDRRRHVLSGCGRTWEVERVERGYAASLGWSLRNRFVMTALALAVTLGGIALYPRIGREMATPR